LEKLEIIANALVSDIIDVLKRGKSFRIFLSYLMIVNLVKVFTLFEDLSGLNIGT
jgi:hypothetical protein